MNSKEKIEYMLRKVREQARINPAGFFYVDCTTIVDAEANGGIPDEAPVLISRADQVNLLKKFKQDGLLFAVDFGKEYKGAWVALMSLDKDMDADPYSASKKRSGLITIKLTNGSLRINKDTGFVQLNRVKTGLNPTSQEFVALLKLMTNKDCRAKYAELFSGGDTKNNRRLLAFVIRNLKMALGILPKKKAKNKEIIENIKGYGYKLIT